MPEYKLSIARDNAVNLSSEWPQGDQIEYADSYQDSYERYLGMNAGTPSQNWGSDNSFVSQTGAIGEQGLYNPNHFHRVQQDAIVNTEQFDKTWVAVKSGLYFLRPYFAAVNIYKNGTFQYTTTQTWAANGLQVAAGDRITASKPIALRSAQYDLGACYMGWSGYTFGHRMDRYGGNVTLTIAAAQAGTQYKVLYNTSAGHITSLTQQSAGTISSQYGTATATLQQTRNYYIIADKPVACYVNYNAGTGTSDSMPLYPMDADPKFGFLSNGVHTLAAASAGTFRIGNNFAASLVSYNTSNTTTIQYTATCNSTSCYTDDALTGTTGNLFSGPAYKLVADGNSIFTAEQQADSNGGEMTPFISSKAMGRVGMVMDNADWVAFVSNQPAEIQWFDAQDNQLSQFTLSGNSTNGVYKYYINSGVSAGHHFVSVGPGPRPAGFFMYYDNSTTNGDERICIMSDAYGPMV